MPIQLLKLAFILFHNKVKIEETGMYKKKSDCHSDSGFTLIEILIVVVLLGILATIIVPQISVSSDDAKLNTLKTNLGNLRSAIEIYYWQHGNRYPGQYDEANGTAALGNAGDAVDAFVAQLTQYSDANGKTSVNSGTTTFSFGPYLREGLPTNPFNGSNEVTCDVTTTDVTARTAVPGDNTGWRFYTKTGILIANDSTDHDEF
jgi:prepilin-type N-terminal cleavage/methylation domain-containing protein